MDLRGFEPLTGTIAPDLLSAIEVVELSTMSTMYIWRFVVYPITAYGGQNVQEVHPKVPCGVTGVAPGCTRHEGGKATQYQLGQLGKWGIKQKNQETINNLSTFV